MRSSSKALDISKVCLSTFSPQCLLPAPLTRAVLGCHCIPIEARGADLAPCTGCVVHAPRAGTRQGVAAAEEHVGIRVPAAVAGLARTANHQGIAVVSWGTPGETWQVKTQPGHCGDPQSSCWHHASVLSNYNSDGIQHLQVMQPSGISKHSVFSLRIPQKGAFITGCKLRQSPAKQCSPSNTMYQQ